MSPYYIISIKSNNYGNYFCNFLIFYKHFSLLNIIYAEENYWETQKITSLKHHLKRIFYKNKALSFKTATLLLIFEK